MNYLHLSLVIILYMITHTASADEYTDEMDRYIVNPCTRISAIYQDLDYMMDIDEAVTRLKSVTGISETITNLVYTLIPKSEIAISDLKDRKIIYGFALHNCAKGALGLK